MALIVETVTGDTTAEICAARDRVGQADLVELRVDGVRDLDISRVLAGRRLPAIVTCRPVWEGGRFAGGEDARLGILREAIRLGVEHVDVEWRADWRALPRDGTTRFVLSHHDFDGTPADLADRVRAMRAAHDGVIKVAVTARTLRDVIRLRDATRDAGPHVAIAMGHAGMVTRMWPSGFGSVWTYAGSAAPGQLPTRVLAACRVRETTPQSAVYGIVGRPLAHSASPAMHNAAFAAEGLDAVYVPLETSDADEALEVAAALGARGLSVTAPLKTPLVGRTTVLSDAATQAGAVNTLRLGARGWEGENFDVDACRDPLAHALEIAQGGPGLQTGPAAQGGPGLQTGPNQNAVVLGAGGAARAAVLALQQIGFTVSVSARRESEAARLASELDVAVQPWPPAPGWTVLVNATPVGTWPDVDATPIPAALLFGGRIVYDLVYNPDETRLLADARAAGATTIGGLAMLVSQAQRQFTWWTGRSAPADIFEGAAREAIQSRAHDASHATSSAGRL